MAKRIEHQEKKLLARINKEDFLRLKLRPICFASILSTQEYLASIIKSTREGDFAIAEVQYQGKGRNGRTWVSQKGGLWFSIVLTPENEYDLLKLQNMAAKVIQETLEEFQLQDCWIKAPNDVYCKGRKIAGILVDAQIVPRRKPIVYLGIGINLNNDPTNCEELREVATSYYKEKRMKLDLMDFTVRLLLKLDKSYFSLQISSSNKLQSFRVASGPQD